MRRFSTNTLILLANNMGSAALAFLISVVIGRSMGAQGLGQYSFIMAWIAPLVTLADFGLASLLTRDVAQNPDSALPLLRTATRALLIIAGLLFVGAWLVIPISNFETPVAAALAVIVFLILLDPWYGLYTALFRACQQMWPILVVNVGGLILQVALTVFAIRALPDNGRLVGIAAGIIAVNVLQLVVTWRLWRVYGAARSTSPPSPLSTPVERGRNAISGSPSLRSGEGFGVRLTDSEVNFRPLLSILRQSWPFALAAVLNTLQLRLNVLLLEQRSGDVAVGLYSAANRFVEAGRLVPGALFGVLFPALASLAAQPDAMRRTFRRSTLLVVAFAVAFGLSMTLFGGWLLRVTFDPKGATFAGAVPVLMLLAWALLPSLLRAILTLYLYSLKREHFVNAVTLVALACQAVIGWLLIGQWGAIGAAITVGTVEGGTAICLWAALSVFDRQKSPSP